MKQILLQRFLRGDGRHMSDSLPTPVGPKRHRPPCPDWINPATIPGLFYDVYAKNFQNIIPFWAFKTKL